MGPVEERLRGRLTYRGILLAAVAGSVLAAAESARAQQPVPPPESSEPIVPDSEFEDALPPLDPALAEPLEPLEEIAPDPSPFPPVPGPVEDAPLGDPALAKPLPPLETVDVEPVEIGPAEDADELLPRIHVP